MSQPFATSLPLSYPDRLHRAAANAIPPRPRQPRPIVILGAGGIVRNAHLPAYARAGFPVIALADRTPGTAQSLAADFGIARAFDSAEQAIAFAPADAIFDLAVPAGQLLSVLPHLPQGAAVLIQKPMGETLPEAKAILDLCRDRQLTAAVNFQLRFAPANLAAVALAREGLLGDLHDIEVQVRTFTPWSLWTFLAQAPRLEILYHSIHYLDLVRSWLGNPTGIYAKTVRNPQTPTLAATKSTMILDYGDWKRVFIATNHGHDLAPASQRSFTQWEGTEGAIRMEMGVNLDYPVGRPDSLSYIARTGEKTQDWQKIPISGNWFPDAFSGSMGALQAYIEGSALDLPHSVASAYETMALVEAAYRSSQNGAEPFLSSGDTTDSG